MKNVLKALIKVIFILIFLLLLIFLFQISFNFLERKFISNNDYYMITSKYTSIYGIITSLILTFLLFLLLFKNESKKYIPYIFNKKVLPVLILLLVFGYIYSLFKIDVVYDKTIKSYSLFDLKGKEYSLEQIKKVDIYIKKHINQTYSLYYIVDLENKKIEIFEHASDFGLELKKFDHLTLVHKELEKLEIKINKNDKNLDNYLKKLSEEEQKKVKKIFN